MRQTQPVDARAGRQPCLRRFDSTRTDTPVTPDAVCPPTHPERQILPLPAGVAAGMDETIAFNDVQDHEPGTRPADEMTIRQRDFAHPAGNLEIGADAFGGISPDKTMITCGKEQGGMPGMITGLLSMYPACWAEKHRNSLRPVDWVASHLPVL